MRPEPPFPYLTMVAGIFVLVIGAYTPDGKGQDATLLAGSNLISGSLTAYGMQLKQKPEE